MKENNYSVRYARVAYTGALALVSIWDEKARTKKFTLDGARDAAKHLLEITPDTKVAYCKIYNGKEFIELIER